MIEIVLFLLSIVLLDQRSHHVSSILKKTAYSGVKVPIWGSM